MLIADKACTMTISTDGGVGRFFETMKDEMILEKKALVMMTMINLAWSRGVLDSRITVAQISSPV